MGDNVGEVLLEPHEIADAIARLSDVAAAVEFRGLPKSTAIEVFEELDPFDQQRLLAGMRDDGFREVVEAMHHDDRARMLGEAPAKVVARALAGLGQEERRITAAQLGFPAGSVGRMMTPAAVPVPRTVTVREALDLVRAVGSRADSIHTLPLVDDGRVVVGVATLSALVLAEPEQPVQDVADGDLHVVTGTDSAEEAARLIQETNDVDLVVVDSEGRLLGLLTGDDAMEALEEAGNEDAARLSGAEPWEGHFAAVGVFRLARYRALWLSLLLVAAAGTVTVTQAFEDTLAQVAKLALFIPMLIGAGGNAGAQAATASVRALAIGEARFSDLGRVIWRELRVGLLLGLMLAALGLVVGGFFVSWPIASVVAASLVVICTWAATIGGAMPVVARRIGIDPAVVSAPLVTTLVDATGLVIYFSLAKVILGL